MIMKESIVISYSALDFSFPFSCLNILTIILYKTWNQVQFDEIFQKTQVKIEKNVWFGR